MTGVGSMRSIDGPTGQNSRGFARVRGTIKGIQNDIALVVDQLGRQLQVNIHNLTGSGALPQVGEEWFITRDNGYYTFNSRITPELITVDPTDLTSVVSALVQLGIVLSSITPGSGGGTITPSGSGIIYTQPTPSTVWDIHHMLGRKPLIQVVDTFGHIVDTEVVHQSINELTVLCNPALAGIAIME